MKFRFIMKETKIFTSFEKEKEKRKQNPAYVDRHIQTQ